MSSGKKGQGRQKIEMKKMSNESNLQVTFSKRRSGLFKKASELCTLCGAYIALIVFSPSDKVFSFGHPDVYTVIDRYLSQVPPQNNRILQFIEAHRGAELRELNAMLTQINDALGIKKKRKNELSDLCKKNEAQFWWACPIEGMNKVQLQSLKDALLDLKKRIEEHVGMVVSQGTPTQTLPLFVDNGSSSNMPMEHQPNHQQASIFPAGFCQNPMLQPHLFGFNNMGGDGGHGPSGFY
ncbi:putative transcription factor MADS-type1 family [Medicago truncatula]|uniref:MADS-box transcription factor family protein n=1 Tax=Medicago truncatula TaxID=3880 RepID=G7I4T7_MEDTR|nr:agamous-like MADS-box protein AGL62 [Medicago truncatula]AES61073.1 MADS-box transcription factor family protein [Medicago truncatula]RHN80356.1 putative transcription factor MADS-type1 family [Medicago truncatula]